MLLELITGNKPIMNSSDHQPETLVAWVSCHESLNHRLNVERKIFAIFSDSDGCAPFKRVLANLSKL
jgi:hypothetical protein